MSQEENISIEKKNELVNTHLKRYHGAIRLNPNIFHEKQIDVNSKTFDEPHWNIYDIPVANKDGTINTVQQHSGPYPNFQKAFNAWKIEFPLLVSVTDFELYPAIRWQIITQTEKKRKQVMWRAKLAQQKDSSTISANPETKDMEL